MYWQILKPLRPYRLALAAVICLTVIGSALEAVSLSLAIPLIQAFVPSHSSLPAEGASGIFGFYLRLLASYTPAQRIRYVLVLIGASFLIKHAFIYARQVLGVWVWQRVRQDVRNRIWASVMRADYQFFLNRKQGRLINDVADEPNLAADGLQRTIDQIPVAFSAVALFALLVVISWKLTIAAALIGLVVLVSARALSVFARRIGEERVQIKRDLQALVAEAISGIRQIRVFGAESRLVREYRELNEAQNRNVMKEAYAFPLPDHFVQLSLIAAFTIIVLVSMALRPADLSFIAPLVGSFLLVFSRLITLISAMTQGWLAIQTRVPSVRIVGELLELGEQSMGAEAERRGGRPFRRLERAVEFEDVSFSYPGREDVLRGVSVRFAKGEVTAVVGPSGVGKSTLVDLIVRLFEPTAGRIVADGVDLRAWELASWLARIGLVSQDTFIFHSSIRDNIAFSRPDAPFEEIVWAARQAAAHEFIEEFPQGYDTVVGDRGLKLSGGQRQRIAIARAVLRNPDILIFDEATSALDNRSEQMVQQALDRISHDRTVIVVAHRLSTIEGADKIVVLDDGRIVEEGRHDSLLSKRGFYWRLYARGDAPLAGAVVS